VAYVKALQFSQSVDVAEIPAEEKQRLESMEKPSSSEDGSTATPEEGR
jgi:hypothetical protein